VSALFSNLGITGPAFIAQAANFLIVLIVLGFFVYRPLSKMMEERSKKIAEGLLGAEKADKRLREIEGERRVRLAGAEEEALKIVEASRDDAKIAGKKIISDSELRAQGIVKESKTLAEREKAEGLVSLEREAKTIVRAILEKTVSLKPKLIDDALIEQAVTHMKSNKG
jgi:F-type H+-transporting ATPase subunit b